MNKEHRYAKKTGRHEKKCNIHIREMVEMIKNEEIKSNLYVKGVKLSAHAFKRVKRHFNVRSLATATKMIRDMLKDAVCLGSVLSHKGRINVLYAYKQTAFFLSPDLKTLVTVNKFQEVTYRPFLKEVKRGVEPNTIYTMHLNLLREIETKEEEMIRFLLSIEEKCRDATDQCRTLLKVVRNGERKRDIKDLISDQNHQLKIESRKLFQLKVEKRRLCKSLVSLT